MPRKPKPTQAVDPTISVRCMQCDDKLVPLLKPRLYCSIACEQEAELVRYIRRCASDGRIDQEDVQIAITTRLAHIASGGYDRKARRLTDQQRTAVVASSNGLCAICGKPGIDIDHIDGPSGYPANLQLLCKDCHEQKTFTRIVPVEPGSESYERVKAIHERIWSSAEAAEPQRPCHDERTWTTQWRAYQKERAAFVLRP